MKILVLSDSHGKLENARNVIERIGNDMSAVFHLGDLDIDAMNLAREFPLLPFHFVRGNNEYGGTTPSKKLVVFNGRKFLLTHGHLQKVSWNFGPIVYWGEEQGVDVVVFGHTHTPLMEQERNMMLFNPGSISLPRMEKTPTFGILDISDSGIIKGSIMEYIDKDTFHRR